MNQEQSLEDIILIPSTPSKTLIERLRKLLKGLFCDRDKLDEVTKNLNMPASLLNFYFATSLDLSLVGLGHVVHIPVQISKREGGRKSILYLEAGEETLTGI